MCVYFWVDTDKEKSQEAIQKVLDRIDDIFDRPDEYAPIMLTRLQNELARVGYYDWSTQQRLTELAKDQSRFKSVFFSNLEQEMKKIKQTGKAGLTDVVPIHTEMDSCRLMTFGMKGFDKTMLFNTRSEDMNNKPTWKGLVQTSRCIISANQYIETHTDLSDKKKKTQYLFWLPGHKRIYMAGIYRMEESIISRFTILTRQAVGTVEQIHERMPVILTEDQAVKWLEYGTKGFDRPIYEAAETNVEYEKYNRAG
jgi:putative SOS response-associated peptidase YedK